MPSDIWGSFRNQAFLVDQKIIVDEAEKNVLGLSEGAEFDVTWAVGHGEVADALPEIHPDDMALQDLRIHFRFVALKDNTVIEQIVQIAGLTAEEHHAAQPPFRWTAYQYLELLSDSFVPGVYNFRPYIEWPGAAAFSGAPRDYLFLVR